jgi:hypothetical protein
LFSRAGSLRRAGRSGDAAAAASVVAATDDGESASGFLSVVTSPWDPVVAAFGSTSAGDTTGRAFWGRGVLGGVELRAGSPGVVTGRSGGVGELCAAPAGLVAPAGSAGLVATAGVSGVAGECAVSGAEEAG